MKTKSITAFDGFRYTINDKGIVMGQVKHGSREMSPVVDSSIAQWVRRNLGRKLAHGVEDDTDDGVR